ncbi:Valine--tRNA ligase [subsurface metagenome]
MNKSTKGAIQDSISKDSTGQSTSGKDQQNNEAGQTVMGESGKEKTAKEIEKERKKAEKLAKFNEKNAKKQAAPAAAPSKPKEKPKKTSNVDAYEPSKIEAGRYEWWESRGYFKPQLTEDGKVKPEGKFVIAIPPPNVTGALHMGHAITNSLQDTMIRHARMRGKTTLYVPGCDHAGIATQAVVERMLMREEGKTRHDIGREGLLELIWKWKGKYHANITKQLRRMGGSMDWSREAFTMDEIRADAVKKTFIQLFNEGIIYRDNRLVNWSSALSTSLSNIEVDNKELSGRQKIKVPGYDKLIEFGLLTYFKYPISKDPKTDEAAKAKKYEGYQFIEVATTRPETMLGDTAVAVHPKDERYKDLVGKLAVHPFIPGRKVLIIADEEVEMEFGTGAVKITPAHDPDDFAKGKRHKLEFINILTDAGLVNENGGPFEGQKRFDVRYGVIEGLKDLGLYSKQEDNAMTIPICSRSGDVVESVMKPQWWMKMKDMAEAGIEAVTSGAIKIRPESESRHYLQWMRGMTDWCLSRQLWWGHRCPAYLVEIEGETLDEAKGDNWVCAENEEEAQQIAEKKFPGKKFTLRQDEDVLDTWFSSGLWPWAILGWPQDTQDMQNFYPTSILETGWDILTFWVSRMIMLGLKMTGKIPFSEVYCHSLVRDSEGRKMSKSLGNVVDPVDIIQGISLEKLHETLLSGNLPAAEIERAKQYQKKAFPKGIEECGADALRFTLVNYTTGGGDINFDIREIEAKRRFCNKIYQATNFVLGRLGDDFKPAASALDNKPQTLVEKWILHRFNEATKDINAAIEGREFSKSAGTMYQYWFTSLCDTFIENSKFLLAPEADEAVRNSTLQTLYTALEGGLVLLHPLMPFLTEHLWQKLPRRQGDKTEALIIAQYPTFEEQLNAPMEAEEYELIMEVAKGIRSLLSQYEFKEPGDLIVQTYTDSAQKTLSSEQTSLKSLGGKYCGEVTVEASETAKVPAGCAVSSINADVAVYLKVAGRIDFETEITKINSKLDVTKGKIEKSQGIIASAGFTKASPDSQEKEKDKLKDAEGELERLEAAIKDMERLKVEDS